MSLAPLTPAMPARTTSLTDRASARPAMSSRVHPCPPMSSHVLPWRPMSSHVLPCHMASSHFIVSSCAIMQQPLTEDNPSCVVVRCLRGREGLCVSVCLAGWLGWSFICWWPIVVGDLVGDLVCLTGCFPHVLPCPPISPHVLPCPPMSSYVLLRPPIYFGVLTAGRQKDDSSSTTGRDNDSRVF